MKKPTKESLDAIQMLNADLVANDLYRTYYNQLAGENHYRLLHWVSHQYADETFIDIGTHLGTSAIALSASPDNHVISYDIEECQNKQLVKKNVELKLESAIKDTEIPNLRKSPFILLDIVHDGFFEFELLRFLTESKWTGILMIDDIHLDPVKHDFWEKIQVEKEDWTDIGHFSGTGIALFK